jgi:phosphoglycerol transferase MdoB-like AlkP superfamily enzyme
MQNSANPNTRTSTKTSWIMMAIALASLIFLALYIPPNRRANIRLLIDFKVEIPTLTQWILATPDFVFPVAAIALGIAAILVQWRGHGSVGSASFHMFLILACAAFFVVYRESLLQPIAELIRQVSSPSVGG